MFDFAHFPAVCRTCLKPAIDLHISQEAQIERKLPVSCTVKYHELINQLTQVSPELDQISDELPSHLCTDCANKLVEWFHWKHQTIVVLKFSRALASFKRSRDLQPIKELLDTEGDRLRQCLYRLQVVDRQDFSMEELLEQIRGTTTDEIEMPIEEVELVELENADDRELNSSVEEASSKPSKPSKIIRRNGARYKVCILAGCNEEYEMGNRTAYLRHEKIFHRYGCNLCGRVLASRTSFRNHVLLHDGAKVECDFCDRRFTTRGGMRVHVREVHITSGVHFNCQYCDEGFIEQKDLFNHLQEHRECKPCKETFQDLAGWINHNKRQHTDSLHSCTQCDHTSLSRALLDRHMRMRHSESAVDSKVEQFTIYAVNDSTFHQCPQCSFQFVTEQQLLNHNEQAHNRPQEEPSERPSIRRRTKEEREQFSLRYSCDVCGKKYRFKNSLWSHKHKEHNSAGSQTAVCEICGQHFKHRSYLMAHIANKHATELPFQCKLCPRAYPQNYLLKEHVKSHDAEKKHRCPHCDYRAKHSYALKDHIGRMHNGDERAV
ncbi:hypothetical protein pipiens_007158 [Culex pipiens pipiens]|uniref:Uncharacterized protein n=1 Tax=Culex pipiens pipiens TaxID=38569 RepID=A0ABD1DM16_CULPP